MFSWLSTGEVKVQAGKRADMRTRNPMNKWQQTNTRGKPNKKRKPVQNPPQCTHTENQLCN